MILFLRSSRQLDSFILRQTLSTMLKGPVAHAHRDSNAGLPVHTAFLDHGFRSFEADTWLIGGKVFIGHSYRDLSVYPESS